MQEKIERQKINERDELGFEEKQRIALKSNHKCAHCGREVYFGYGATIDHFIPVSKGGTNRDVNLIMLCKECNKEKGDLIFRPGDYAEYLNDVHMDKLMGYFESYVTSFEYIERRNILACDRYTIFIEPPIIASQRVKQRSTIAQSNAIRCYLHKAELGDIPMLQAYFIKYLRKYDMLDDIEAARLNIEFWMRFGCIYYIEKNSEIKLMLTVTATEDDNMPGSIKWHLMSNIFSYYNTDYAYTLVRGIMDQIPSALMTEQRLKMIPVCYGMAKNDKLTGYITNSKCGESCNFKYVHILYHIAKDEKSEEITTEDEAALADFFSKFGDIYEDASRWLSKRGKNIGWMLTELKSNRQAS